MGARQRLGAAARGLIGAGNPNEPEAFTVAGAEALRADLELERARLAAEIEQLATVVAALQEQLDRWTHDVSATTDHLGERLATLEAASQKP